MSWGLQRGGDLLPSASGLQRGSGGDRSPLPRAPPALRVCHLLVFTRLSLGKGTWSVESCELMTQEGTDVTHATQRTAAQVVLCGGGAAGVFCGGRGWATGGGDPLGYVCSSLS